MKRTKQAEGNGNRLLLIIVGGIVLFLICVARFG